MRARRSRTRGNRSARGGSGRRYPRRASDIDGRVTYSTSDDAETYSVVDEVARRSLCTGARVLARAERRSAGRCTADRNPSLSIRMRPPPTGSRFGHWSIARLANVCAAAATLGRRAIARDEGLEGGVEALFPTVEASADGGSGGALHPFSTSHRRALCIPRRKQREKGQGLALRP
jgi:hypothetical protein